MLRRSGSTIERKYYRVDGRADQRARGDLGWRRQPSGRTLEFDSDHNSVPSTTIATAPIMMGSPLVNSPSVSRKTCGVMEVVRGFNRASHAATCATSYERRGGALPPAIP